MNEETHENLSHGNQYPVRDLNPASVGNKSKALPLDQSDRYHSFYVNATQIVARIAAKITSDAPEFEGV